MVQTLTTDLGGPAGDLLEPKVETWQVSFGGRSGELPYYRVHAEEYADGHFEVYVHYLGQVSGAWATVAQAERFIVRHHHYLASGHLPGTCHCLSD